MAVVWYEHPDFIGMLIGLVFGMLLLIIFPCTWLPLTLTPLGMPTYELRVEDCLKADTWFFNFDSICSSSTEHCMDFSEGSLWMNIDADNMREGYKTSLYSGANAWLFSAHCTVASAVMAAVYILALIAMLWPKYANPCMILQLVSVCATFFLLLVAYMAQQSSAQLYPSSWETSYFAGCNVTITPMFAHTQMSFCLLTQSVLLLMVAICSTSWYCYACGCVQYLISCVSPDSSSSDAELSSLIANAKSSGYNSISNKKRILFLISDTGGGHRASARAIVDALNQTFPGKFDTEILDIWTKYAKFPFQNAVNHYRIFTQHPWLWKVGYDFTGYPVTRLFSEIISHLTSYESFKVAIAERMPDLIVSVHPLCQYMPTRIVAEINRELSIIDPSRSPMKFCTVVSDLIDCHQTWFSGNADAIFVPTQQVYDLCLSGSEDVDPRKVRIHGLPIRPEFWNPITATKESMRSELGLANMRTVMLMAGGDGVGALVDIVTNVANKVAGSIPTQLIVICGKNETMVADLTSPTRVWPTGVTVVVKGFINNVDQLMTASNILVTKAGPGTIAEAMIVGLPLVLSTFLPGQEAGNVPYVVDGGFGLYGNEDSACIAECVQTLLNDERRLTQMSKIAKEKASPKATLAIAKDVATLLQTSHVPNV